MNFASDNAIRRRRRPSLRRSSRPIAGGAPAYGADSFTQRAEAALSEIFERPVASFLVSTGTAANALALGALAPPWSAIFCHEEAHIHDDECGAPELFTGGAKLVGIAGEGRQDHAGRPARNSGALSARSRQIGAAGRPVAFAGDGSRHDLYDRRDRRSVGDRP